MDNSKKYIEMCKKAVVIQEVWNPQRGDFHACGCGSCLKRKASINCIGDAEVDILNGRCFDNVDEVYKRYAESYGGHFVDHFNECRELIVWLPRQDQLQEIVVNIHDENYSAAPIESSYSLAVMFVKNWMLNARCESWMHGMKDSMEKLWLAFVMQKKFNKIWNGEDWEC